MKYLSMYQMVRFLSLLVDGFYHSLENLIKIDNIMIQSFVKNYMFIISLNEDI